MNQPPEEKIPSQEPLEDRPGNLPDHEVPEHEGKARAAAFDVKKPSRMTGLFRPDTRTGQVGRALVRLLALAVVMFALGVLATYLRMVAPLKSQLAALQASYQESQSVLEKSRQELTVVNDQAKAAGDLSGKATSRLGFEQARTQLLAIRLELADARRAILEKEKTAAGKAIDNAEKQFKEIGPQTEAMDADQFKSIQAVFTLIHTDMNRDQQIVVQDIDRLSTELELVEKNLVATDPAGWQCQCDSYQKP